MCRYLSRSRGSPVFKLVVGVLSKKIWALTIPAPWAECPARRHVSVHHVTNSTETLPASICKRYSQKERSSYHRLGLEFSRPGYCHNYSKNVLFNCRFGKTAPYGQGPSTHLEISDVSISLGIDSDLIIADVKNQE